MSFLTNQIAQMRAVVARHNGNAVVFAGRDKLLGGNGGSEMQIHQGNFNAKFAGAWEDANRKKMKKAIKLSGFDTFA